MHYGRVIAFLAGILMTNLGSNTQACTFPDWGTWQLTVEVVADEINLVALTNDLDFGGLWAGENAFSNQPQGHPRCSVENRGYAVVNFTVSATCSTGWTLGTALGDTGENRVVLAGVFTVPGLESESYFPYGRNLVLGNYGNNDVITTVSAVASQTVFAIDPGSGGIGDDLDYVKGFNADSFLRIRHLRFLVQAPTSDTTGIEQLVTIIIGAVVQ